MDRTDIYGEPDHYYRAIRRVGLSADDTVRWLLAFGQDELEPPHWKDAYAEACAFVLARGRIPAGGDIRALYHQLRDGLRALAAGRRFVREVTVKTGIVREPDGALAAVGGGDLDSVFFVCVFEVLREVGSRVRTCPRCGRLFLATAKQEYCSKRCSQAVRTERFREKHPDKIKTARRRRYAKKRRAQYGPKVKIGTRRV